MIRSRDKLNSHFLEGQERARDCAAPESFIEVMVERSNWSTSAK